MVPSRGVNGADKTTGIAAKYVTEHTVDITTPVHTGNGSYTWGTGTEGENPEKEEEEV